ncbi:MAG TPA: glycosyltransferase, partial [Alphaproteobacteria bacterium]|nr:glycosyltransferase [Alphaproteobacteria bacterium]
PLSTRIVFVVLFLLTSAAALMAPFLLSTLLLPVMAVLFLVPAGLRLSASFMPAVPRDAPRLLADRELPVYTVLIPLRDEAGMVPLLKRAMDALDYPAEKLDIKFVVEERSVATIAAVEAMLRDSRFELIPIPDAKPHTKPKALNYALPLARGEYLVVYDAEDIPDPGQLRLAASRFAAEPGLDCIQAELVIDNAAENTITALFAGEYAGQFGLMLPFLGRHRLPMPLCGTSNHFRLAALRELGHWDAFNVTEDADLGVRLSRLRYRSDVLASETSEEAPITLGAWMVQRTRWIKGWMQTFIVHNRSVPRLLADIGWRNFLVFEIYVGGLILSALLHTLFAGSLVVRAALGLWPDPANPVDLAYLLVLAIGYGAAAVQVIGGIVRRRAWHLLPAQALLPFYWLLHSAAALNAAFELIVRPYFWGKTAHGRTRRERRFAR